MIRPGVTSRSRGDARRGPPRARGRRPSGAASADPVHARRYAATARRAAPALKPRRCVELLPGPLVLAGLHELARRARRAARRAPRRRGRRTPATARAAAASTSRRRSAPCACEQPEQRLDQRGQADPRVAEQPAGQLGVEQRGRRAARPRRRQGRSWWRRAGSTRRRRGPPASGVEVVEARSGRPARCRRPRGAAGSGRRAAE